MDETEVAELLMQALETEIGGAEVYETAINCAQNKELKKEWERYHRETKHHIEVVRGLVKQMGLDPEERTPGREVVHTIGHSLVQAMEKALKEGPEGAAQIVAAECVTLAETKDHLNWELLGEVSKELGGEMGKAIKQAYKEIEDQEDEHLYHTRGWARELWMEALGLPAVVPPPEEKKKVKTEIAAARAKQEREKMT